MANSEARGTAKVVQLRPAPQVEGIEVTEISAAEFLEAQNGRLKLPVPHVAGERVVEMRGTVPESWAVQS
jgi:hypothetical protein